MQYTINEIYQKVTEKIFGIYDIFKRNFGEDKVDLQNEITERFIERTLQYNGIERNSEGLYVLDDSEWEHFEVSIERRYAYILIWWPEVTVSNENDRSIVIKDLYGKVAVTIYGTIPYEYRGFMLTKSTFSNKQYSGGYVHSHLPMLSGNKIPSFENPCLGRGPIKNTIAYLKTEYDEVNWMLFCRELALYVTVESLQGGPYIKMENLDRGQVSYIFKTFYQLNEYDYPFFNYTMENYNLSEVIKEFIPYYIDHANLNFSYVDNHYIVTNEAYDYILDVSNCFIQWLNEKKDKNLVDALFDRTVLLKVKISNRKFYASNILSQTELSRLNGTPLNFSFKGNPVTLRIDNTFDTTSEISTLLHYTVCMKIMSNILQIINYEYHNKYNNSARSTSQGATDAHKAVCYL